MVKRDIRVRVMTKKIRWNDWWFNLTQKERFKIIDDAWKKRNDIDKK